MVKLATVEAGREKEGLSPHLGHRRIWVMMQRSIEQTEESTCGIIFIQERFIHIGV